MKYTETNKLIALFMGATYLPISEHYILPDMVSYLPEDMKFHTSWDWLMPVVEKTSSMVYFDHFPFSFQDFLIARGKVRNLPIHTPLEEVYKAVIQFINWYNQRQGIDFIDDERFSCPKCKKYPFAAGCLTESGSYHASQFCQCNLQSASVNNDYNTISQPPQ